MVTVSTESTNVSYQASRSKSARDDQTSGAESFASLVDSNSAADNATVPAPTSPAPSRTTDDRSSSDARSARDNDRAASASAADARDSNARDSNARADKAADASSDAKAAADAKKPQAKDKNAKSKGDGAAAADGDKKPATDQTKDAGKAANADAIAATAIVTPPVVPVAVTVPVAATEPTTPAAVTADTGTTAQAPAAAIAALAAKATEGATTATTTATVATDSTTVDDEQFAAIIGAATPTTGKAGLKQAANAEAKTSETASGKSDGKESAAATGSSATGPVGAPQPAAKGKGDRVGADGAKTEAATVDPAPAKTAATGPHEHQAAAPSDQTDSSQLAANNLQPQLQPAADGTPTVQLTATAALPTTPVPLNGLAMQIAVTAQAGNSRFEIRRDPAELGRIDVRMDVDRHGQVTSHLVVERPETLAMLRQDAPQLQRALEQAGLKTGDGGLQFSLRDQSSSGQQNGQNNQDSGRNAQRLIVSEDTVLPAVAAGRNYGRMLSSNSGVDIRL
ncbi:hypothetical protein BH11PSE4_BH11PSE4_26580 [soil metagenome]